TAEGCEVEVAPGCPHRFVTAVVDEICAEHPLAVAEEHVVAVPFIDAEVHVEAGGDGVPGHLPAHPRLQARDVPRRRTRSVDEGGVASVQMGQVRDLICAQGAAAAGMLGPAEHPGFEEGAVDDQLSAALEQVEQANLAIGPLELVLLLHRHPWHPSTLGGQRITGAGESLLLHKELLLRSFPLLLRDDLGSLHRHMPFRVLLISFFACCHVIVLCFLKQMETTHSEEFSELADAHRQNSCDGSGSGDHHCCACDACWTHMFVLRFSSQLGGYWPRDKRTNGYR